MFSGINKNYIRTALCVILLAGFVFALSASTALANPPPFGDPGEAPTAAKCVRWFSGINISACITGFAAWTGWAVLWVLSWLLWAASKILNIVLAVQNTAFYNNALVNTGWMISRDVVNIFYVLILLIISIATILRIESYGAKQLLWKIIISALLVNFSLPLAGVVVDFSNALGNSFYANMGKEQDPDLENSSARDLSATLMEGFNPGKIYEMNKDYDPDGKLIENLINIAIGYFMGAILILIASFVILAAAFLLVIRIIAIWILFILAPFAFLFWILPGTEGYARTWAQKLFQQAFFYPAFMFMLYLVFVAIQSKVISGLFNATISRSDFYFKMLNQVNNILGFITLAVLLIAALLVAKQMGAYGAGAVMKTGSKWGKGAAVGMRRGTGRFAARVAARPAERVLKDTKTLARIPLLGRAITRPMEKIVQRRERDAAKEAARIKNLSPAAAATTIRNLNAHAQAKAWGSMNAGQQSQMTKELNERQQITLAKNLKRAEPHKSNEHDVAVASGNIATAMKILHEKDKPGTNEYQEHVDTFVSNLNEQQLRNIKPDQIRDNEHFQKVMLERFGGKDIRRITETKEGAEAVKHVFDQLVSKYGEAGAETHMNERLKKWMDKSPAAKLIIEQGRVSTKRDLDVELKQVKQEGATNPEEGPEEGD